MRIHRADVRVGKATTAHQVSAPSAAGLALRIDNIRASYKGVEVEYSHEDIPSRLYWTNAPTDYDGFGTRRLNAHREWDGEDFQLVDILDRHREWQKGRYASGLFVAMPVKYDEVAE